MSRKALHTVKLTSREKIRLAHVTVAYLNAKEAIGGRLSQRDEETLVAADLYLSQKTGKEAKLAKWLDRFI